MSRRPILIIVMFALALAAFLIYNFSGQPQELRESLAELLKNEPAAPETPVRTAQTASRQADRPPVPRPAPGADAPTAEIVANAYNIVILRIDDEGPVAFDDDESQPVGKGRTGQLAGSINIYHIGSEPSGASVEIVAGLNSGRKAIVEKDGRYKLERLYPGAAILRVSTKGGRVVDRDIVILRNLDTRLDVSVGPRGASAIPVYDIQEKPIENASITAGGRVSKQLLDRGSSIENVVPPETLTYISAPGFENRRENIRFDDSAIAPIDPKLIVLRRAGNVIIKFDLLESNDPPPVAVLLPASMIVKQKYPFEMFGMRKAATRGNEIIIEGVPLNEAFDICIFCETANAVPPLIHLRALDVNEPVPRIANFSFERRWTVSGRLISGGRPIEGALVRAEVINIADATDKMFESNGGIDRVPYPVLPFARRVVTTNRAGEFKLETYDMRRPAYIIFEAPGKARKTIEMPPGGIVDLLNINIESKSESDKSSSILFNFNAAAPRVLNIYHAMRSELRTRELRFDPKPVDVARFIRTKKESDQKIGMTDRASDPVKLEPGDYEIYISGPHGFNQIIREHVSGVTRIVVDGDKIK